MAHSMDLQLPCHIGWLLEKGSWASSKSQQQEKWKTHDLQL
jgi:hypothetical protein